MNFNTSALTDICWWESENGLRTYFFLNASMGITAEANGYFNQNLSTLKQYSTSLSIFWAALRTLFVYQNRSLQLSLYGNRQVTNLAIVRNRHFSGDFKYPRGEPLQSGHFQVYLCENLSKRESLRALYELLQGRFWGPKQHQCRASLFSVQSKTPFWVESDGEVSQQTHLTFGIDRSRILLCS